MHAYLRASPSLSNVLETTQLRETKICLDSNATFIGIIVQHVCTNPKTNGEWCNECSKKEGKTC